MRSDIAEIIDRSELVGDAAIRAIKEFTENIGDDDYTVCS